MVRVAVLKVDNYDKEMVGRAIEEGFFLLGLENSFFKEKKVLLKPNLLVPTPIKRAVCSHPFILTGAAALVMKMNGKVEVGDSPGFGSVFKAAESCGIARCLRELEIPLVSFEDIIEVRFPQGRVCKKFPLCRPVVNADMVISIARLKTHNLTRYTGAVKNLYGCIPGRNKAALHFRYKDVNNFSIMLSDLLGLINPALSIVDGIVSMEGPGPRRGNPRKTGFLVMSEDAVAADVVSCKLVGINPKEVLHLKFAGEMGLGEADYNKLELVGDKADDLKVKNFEQAEGSTLATGYIPSFLVSFIRNHFIPLPHIIAQKCRGCNICVESCPAGIIKMSRTAQIDKDKCIRCYCCQELCPHEAIILKRRLRLK